MKPYFIRVAYHVLSFNSPTAVDKFGSTHLVHMAGIREKLGDELQWDTDIYYE